MHNPVPISSKMVKNKGSAHTIPIFKKYSHARLLPYKISEKVRKHCYSNVDKKLSAYDRRLISFTNFSEI